MKKITENFEHPDPVQKREIEEESELYIEGDPRNIRMNPKLRTTNIKEDDRGPSAERNHQESEK